MARRIDKEAIQRQRMMQNLALRPQIISQAQHQLHTLRHILENPKVQQLLLEISLLKTALAHLLHKIFLFQQRKLCIRQQEKEIIGLQMIVSIPPSTGKRTLPSETAQLLNNRREPLFQPVKLLNGLFHCRLLRTSIQPVLLLCQSKMDENQEFTAALTEEYNRLYGGPEQPAMEKAIKKFHRLKKRFPPVIKELSSFRGQSPLSCGVWDTDDHLQTYDLFFLLANTEFALLEEEDFMQEVRKRGLEEGDFQKQLLYFRVFKYVPERMQLVLGLRDDLGAQS